MAVAPRCCLVGATKTGEGRSLYCVSAHSPMTVGEGPALEAAIESIFVKAPLAPRDSPPSSASKWREKLYVVFVVVVVVDFPKCASLRETRAVSNCCCVVVILLSVGCYWSLALAVCVCRIWVAVWLRMCRSSVARLVWEGVKKNGGVALFCIFADESASGAPGKLDKHTYESTRMTNSHTPIVNWATRRPLQLGGSRRVV